MEERRKNKRTLLSSKLILKRLDGGEPNEVDIHVSDLSKTGIGFSCDSVLSIGAMYEANLTIWTKEVIHSVIEIIRIEKKEDTVFYGGVFVGMSEVDAFRIQTYQIVEDIK